MCKADDAFEMAMKESQKAKDIIMRMTDGPKLSIKTNGRNRFTVIPQEALGNDKKMHLMSLYGTDNVKICHMEPGSFSKLHFHTFPEDISVISGEVTYIIKSKMGDRKGILKNGESIRINRGEEHILLSSVLHSYIAITT